MGSTTTNSVICIGFTTSLSGTGASSYVWTNGVTNAAVFSPTITRTYTVTGTDANGCVNTAQRTVTVNALPNVGSTTTNSVVCIGFSTSLSGTGASTYVWSNGITNGASFVPALTATYVVTGTDVNGCVNTAQRTITVNPLPNVGSTTSNSVICNGFTTSLNGTGANTYVWTNGVINGVVFSPTSTTNYTVTGTDGNGCQNTAQRTITVNALPNVGSTTTNSVICIGFTTSLNGTGANTYVWSPLVSNGTAFSPSITVIYTVTGTDGNGCSNTALRTITVNPLPNVGSTTTNSMICLGFSTSLSGTGANSYVWTNGVFDAVAFSPTTTINYTVTGTDINGCINSAQRSITVNPLPIVSMNSGTVCSNKTFTLNPTITPTGSATYTLTGGSFTVSPPGNTIYTVSATNSLGCVSSNIASATVIVRSLPNVNVSGGSICIGKVFTISPTGATSYTYSSGSATVSPASVGNYTYAVIGSSLSCVSPSPVVLTITVNPLPVLSINGNTVLCEGQSSTLTATGANNYNWGASSGSVIIVTPSVSTSYSVVGTNLNGCTSNTVTSIVVNTNPTITVNSGVMCPGASFTLNLNGADTYSSTGGSTAIVSPSVTTNYSITGTNSLGCVSPSPAIATVSVVTTLTVSATGNTVVCNGESTTLTPNGGGTYIWNTTFTDNPLVITPTVNSSYTLVGYSGNCSDTTEIKVTVNPLPTLVAVSASSIICIGESTTLNVSGADTYTWLPTQTNGISLPITPSVNTTYTIAGTDINGCKNETTVVQLVDECLGIGISTGTTKLGVYPNPNSGEFFVEIPIKTNILILNSIGEIILKQQLTAGKNTIRLNEFANGVYFIKESGENNFKPIKIVKQ